jgi:predicted  nucleic acid-binding Zn-ribbon protein
VIRRLRFSAGRELKRNGFSVARSDEKHCNGCAVTIGRGTCASGASLR